MKTFNFENSYKAVGSAEVNNFRYKSEDNNKE